MSPAKSVDVHPVKVEIFDTQAGTNTDPKARVHPVDTFQENEHGLYMARGADHERFGYLESWLLPGFHLRVSIFHFRDGHDTGQRLYVDVVEIEHSPGSPIWRTRDLYLDLLTFPDRESEVLDIDELVAAHAEGFITDSEAELAMTTLTRTLAGSVRYSDDTQKWLAAQGVELSWATSVTLIDASS